MRRLSVLGVPSSAASYASGQEMAPAALRAAGLLSALRASGREVCDAGDLTVQVWKPDRVVPLAQNAGEVLFSVQELADSAEALLRGGDEVLVLGGDCTVALGIMAALRRLDAGRAGLLYLDRHFDMNTPLSTTDGALGWMGMAHALDLPGSLDALAGAFGRRPLLEPDQVAWLGVDAAMATEWEREQAARLDLHVASSGALTAEPAHAAANALKALPTGPLAVHLDVDVLDFTDAPLAENTDGRNTGPNLDEMTLALRAAVTDRRFRVLSIGQLNPTRALGVPEAIPRFVRTIADLLAA
jgi:arginase